MKSRGSKIPWGLGECIGAYTLFMFKFCDGSKDNNFGDCITDGPVSTNSCCSLTMTNTVYSYSLLISYGVMGLKITGSSL